MRDIFPENSLPARDSQTLFFRFPTLMTCACGRQTFASNAIETKKLCVKCLACTLQIFTQNREKRVNYGNEFS